MCSGPIIGVIFFDMDSILRTNRIGNFTAVSNDFIRDSKLSWKAKGIVIYVMSLPENWQLHLAELAKHAKDGRDATNNGIRELIENGYCMRKEIRDSRGMFAGYEYTISDVKEFAPETENPFTDNPHTGNPHTGKPDIINTNTEQTFTLTDSNKPADGGLFPSEPINSEKPKVCKGTTEPLCLFADSKYNRYEDFAACFTAPEFANVDLSYYHGAVSDWSAQKGKKMRDWISTARNFMRGDIEKKKLHTLKEESFDIEGFKKYCEM